MIPPTLPLFPLPNVVLFPNVFLPLHIFEPRYRQMVEHVLAAERVIGMVLLKPGYETEYERTPPVYPIGCAGSITQFERFPDGRFNIVLKGVRKFQIDAEHRPHADVLYRTADVTTLDDQLEAADRTLLERQRSALEERLAPLFSAARSASRLPEIMSDEDLVNALAQYLALEPIEKQALLEMAGPVDRAKALLELLDMKTLAPGASGSGGTVH